ncbi:MAG: DNA polymerase III subunit delta' [Deltaproteobacteria bacterium]|nr:DNA polymerase III subunit delta' [Deltaproteobacteria bacterium]MDZ4347723.1 DNA polymerase III subunit delta' [Candidatus Binatia bacterium]
MGFAEIIGHQRPLEILRLALGNGRLHHAYLFVGPEGSGKRTVALALAKAIHCRETENDFCDRCPDCARIQARNHPDVRLVQTLEDKKEISIKQVRELEKELNFRSFSGKRKIAIIDPATLLNASSQNALLKTLEEPPQNSLIVLIAPNAGALLPTLRSRCLRVSFGPLARDEVARYLMSKEGMNQDDASLRAALSMGSLGAAIKFDKDELLEKRRSWAALLLSLSAGDYRGAIAAAEAIASDKEECLGFLEWAETWYRDLLIYAATENSDEMVNVDMLTEIESQSAKGNFEQMLASFAQTARAAGRIQRNLNRRMVIERFLFGVVGGR